MLIEGNNISIDRTNPDAPVISATAGGSVGPTIDLPKNDAPGVPALNNVRLFGRFVAGRMLPAFVGPSGLDSSIQPFIARNKIAWANPTGNGTTISTMGITLSATGTATGANVATTNIHTAMRRIEYAVATAAATAVAGFRSAALQFFIGGPGVPFGGFMFITRFGPSRGVAANATRRMFMGMSSITGAPTDVNPSTAMTNCIGVCCDAGDTNWHFVHRAGTAAASKVDTGFSKLTNDNSTMYELVIFTPPSSTEVYMSFTNLATGAVVEYSSSSNMPAANQLLAPSGYASVGGVSSVIGISLASMYIETDY